MTKTARTHHFQEDVDLADPLTGEQWCMCGLPADNRIHQVPQRTEEQRAAEARRTGERH